MRKILAVALLVLACLAFPASALASVGVGVGTGRISIKEDIKAGSIYNLPPITVFNTGTENATYTMAVTLNEKQPELKPDPKWFTFSPQQFTLTPNQSQTVVPTFHPPLVTPPGAYFAYLEAHPDQTVQQGATAVGVAAATKLSFTVKASNIFLSILYRLVALYKQFRPWSQVVVIAAGAGLVLFVLNKFLNLRVAFGAGLRARRHHKYRRR